MENNVNFIFLGSVLTFLATACVEYIKWVLIRREKKANFLLLATQQLAAIEKGFERLKVALEQKNYFDYLVLDSLDRGAKSLESYKNDSIYLRSGPAKEKFIDLITDISMYLADTRSVQQLFYAERTKISGRDPSAIFQTESELQKYFDGQKVQKSIDLIEIRRRISDFVREAK